MVNYLPVHFLAYGGLLGVTSYQSFFAGITAYKALPIEMFSKLQHRTFPGYFTIQSVLSIVLLLTPPYKLQRDGLASLSVAALGALLNLFVIIPRSNVILNAREAQMEREGKGYKDPTASDEMKAINKRFSKIHGISMAFNLALILAIFYYGYYFVSRLQVVDK